MKPENRAFLDANRHHHETLVRAQYMRGLNGHEREGMQRVMAEEFQPGYAADLWCPPCVASMVELLYRRYDAWIAAQPKEEPPPDPEPAAEPIATGPAIQVQANFPKHNKNNRR